MILKVYLPEGGLVASVSVAPQCPFAEDPLRGAGFVLGDFEPGPCFCRVERLLAAFLDVFREGNVQAASDSHEKLDELHMIAIDESGVRFSVSNVNFQPGGLLFRATPLEGSRPR